MALCSAAPMGAPWAYANKVSAAAIRCVILTVQGPNRCGKLRSALTNSTPTVYTHLCVCVRVRVCVYVNICTYIHIHACVCARVCVCIL
jgi:hypothetical protein